MKGLLFITHQTEKYDYLQSIEIALKGGCTQIQLRMKNATFAEVEHIARKAKILCDKHGADLYINDHPQICLKVNATGVHLGKTDMTPIEARAILGDKYKIGGTANTFYDIMKLAKQNIDYIGLGPFRFTTTKNNLDPVLGLDEYRQIISLCKDSKINQPILAIGGITINDIPSIMQTGVSGIAMSSAILNAQDPVKETKEILKLINNACSFHTL
jgi:thiamine-phosphate pyrophosphorylase